MPRKPLLIVLIVSALAAISMSPMFQCSSEPAPRIKQAEQLRGLGSLLRGYAVDHGGVLPSRLEEVAKPPSGSEALLLFVNPRNGEKTPWNFDGAGKSVEQLKREDVVVSSSIFEDRGKKTRLQLMGDWNVRFVSAEF